MFRRAIAGLLTMLLALGAVLTGPATPAAAAEEQEYQAAARLLNRYGLVQGDQRGYRFQDPITRGEVAKLLVHALGYGSQAAEYRGRREFSDTAGHWADGTISFARNIGAVQGYPDGRYYPDKTVSYAEAITAMSRLLGLEPGTEAWPRTYLQPARNAGVIPPGLDLDGRLNQAAIRGDVFVLLKRTLADVKNYQGKTLLQTYLDQKAPDLTVDPVPQETQYSSLFVTGVAKEAAVIKINGEAVPFQDGYFRYEVPLFLGPNTIRVHAIDDAGNLKEQVLQVSRGPGAPESVSLRGPARVKAGQSATFAITAYDQNGKEGADPGQIQAEVFPALGRFDVKTGVFTAGDKAGTTTLTVRAGRSQASLSIVVEPGDVERIAITPAEVSLNVGDSQTFVATGFDAHGNEIPLPGVFWSTSGGSISAEGLFVAPVSIGMAVPHTITAIFGGRSATARVLPLNYAAEGVKVTVPGTSMRANGVSQTTLTATVVDDKGKTVTDYKGELTVDSTDEAIVVPVNRTVTVAGGVAFIPVRAGIKPGTAGITVRTNLGRVGTATVTVQEQRLQAVRLQGHSTPSPDGTATGVVEAIALDQDGYPMRSPLLQTVILGLTLTTSGGTATFVSTGLAQADVALSGIDPETGDVRTQIFIAYEAGTGTIMIEGESKPDSKWPIVLAGAVAGDQVGRPAKVKIEPVSEVAAGQTQSIFVNVLDKDGYRVTLDGPLTGVTVTLRDQNGVIWYATRSVQDSDGRLEFQVTQPRAGRYTYTAIMQPGGASDAAVGNVVSLNGTRVELTITPEVLPADGNSQATLRAELFDLNGNRVNGRAYKFAFTLPPLVYAVEGWENREIISSTGVVELKVTAGTVRAGATFRVTVTDPVSGAVVDDAEATLITLGVAQRLDVRYGDNDRDGTQGGPADNVGRAGQPFTVLVDVKDSFGATAAYDNRRPVTLTLLNLNNPTEMAAYSANTVNGTATFTFTRPNAGTYALKAESAGLVKALTQGYGGGTENMVLEPNVALGLQVVSDLQTIEVGGGGNYALVRARLVDANGNPVEAEQPTTVTLQIIGANANVGYFTLDSSPTVKVDARTVVISAGESESNAMKFYSGSTAGSLSIEAVSRDGSKSKAITITVSRALPAVKELKVTSTVKPVDNPIPAINGRLLVITAVDSTGKRVSDFGVNGETITVAGLGNVRIKGYWNGAQWVEINPALILLTTPPDRGQIMVVIECPETGDQAVQVGTSEADLRTFLVVF